jgi:hypothetical protein
VDGITVFQKKLNSTSCFYILASISSYEQFIEKYNSASQEAMTLSMVYLHKSWDALFQANLILSNKSVRAKPDKFDTPLGKITGITEGLLNKKLSHPSTAEEAKIHTLEEIKESAKWFSIFQDLGKLKYRGSKTDDVAKLFNSLDFIRHLRNQSEHDFLDSPKSDYESFIHVMNPYVAPLMREFEKALEEIIQTKISKGQCSTSNTYCLCRKLKPRLKELKVVIRLPIPQNKPREKGSVVALIKWHLQDYTKRRIPLLKDSSFKEANVSNIANFISKTYPYTSLAQVVEASGSKMSVRQAQARLEAHNIAWDSKYVLRTDHKGHKRILYAEELVRFIKQGKLKAKSYSDAS